MREFDVVVIGAGPGGYTAAIRAAQLGARTAVVEAGRTGGTCLNRGCIPTKALYYSAKTLVSARKSSEFGVSVGSIGFDLARAVARKDEVVEKLVSGVDQLLKGNKVEVIRARGTVEGPGRVLTSAKDKSETIAAKSIIVATGSEPAMIPAFRIDGRNVITSTEALNLKNVPESIVIIGGGVMGCEFATLFSAFGSKVTIIELLPEILSTEDRQIVRVVQKRFKESGVEISTGASVESVEAMDGRVRTTLSGGRVIESEKVLVTIGRSFNTTGVGLEAAGVKVEKGRVSVNDNMETSAPGIYAIGDITGKMLLAHVASSQGLVAAANATGAKEKMDYSVIPAGIFTDPEIASVGLKEKEAEAKSIDVKVGRFGYAASGKALAMGETEGFVQMVVDASTDKVLGCSIVGAHATDIIGEAAMAIKAGMKAADIAALVHAHPTLPELVMEASEDVHGMAIHKMGRRRG